VSEVSDQLAAFVASASYDDLSPRASETTKRCLLDALGVSLAASSLGEGCRAFVELATEQGGTPRCTLFGFARKVSVDAAALANGALAHALDYEDAHDASLTHPNAPAVPAALAIAEAFGPVTGKELITALAVGCDVTVRLSLSLKVSLAEFGWYPPPLLAAFGATAAAAKLLRLNEAQIRDAFSLTLCQATCSGEIFHSPDSVVRAIRDAFPARAGVTAALLARRGVTGFDQPFEGRAGFFATFARGHYDADVIVRELGRRFEIENISFKPWPSCRGTHGTIDATLALRKEHALDPQHIARVRIRGGRMLQMLAEPRSRKQRPSTAIDAKFSLPFTAATALVKGRVGLAEFMPSALIDTEVLRLAASVEVDTSFDSPRALETSLELELRDGRTFARSITLPLGAPERALPLEALTNKFVECAAHAARPLDSAQAHRITDAIMTLETAANVDTHLMTLLNGAS
jgi:2-methylcitrate dehydratase PrpD